jgi:hypothetical protein
MKTLANNYRLKSHVSKCDSKFNKKEEDFRKREEEFKKKEKKFKKREEEYENQISYHIINQIGFNKEKKDFKDREKEFKRKEKEFKIKEKEFERKEKEFEKILEFEKKLAVSKSESSMYKKRSEDSDSCIREMAKTPKNITKTKNRQIYLNFPIKGEDANKIIEDGFNTNYFYSGQKGVAQFVNDFMLMSRYVDMRYRCTDNSRKMFNYIDQKGVTHKDPDAMRLTKVIEDGICKKTSIIAKAETDKDKENKMFPTISKHFMNIYNIKEDNSKFSRELSNLTTC